MFDLSFFISIFIIEIFLIDFHVNTKYNKQPGRSVLVGYLYCWSQLLKLCFVIIRLSV